MFHLSEKDTIQIYQSSSPHIMVCLKCTPRLETGMIKVEGRVCLTSVDLSLKLNFYPQGLASLILQDNFQSTWIKLLKYAIQSRLTGKMESIKI